MLHKHNFIEILSRQEYRDDISFSFSTESQDGAQNVGENFSLQCDVFFTLKQICRKSELSNYFHQQAVTYNQH